MGYSYKRSLVLATFRNTAIKEMLVTSSGEHLLQILLLFSVHALVDLRSHIMVLTHMGG